MVTSEEILTRICERLPFNWTLYQENGLCVERFETCKYCKKSDIGYLCKKQTVTKEEIYHGV